MAAECSPHGGVSGGAAGDRADAWPEIDRTVARAARVEDALLGGSAHFAVDRRAAEHAAAGHPGGTAALGAWVRSRRLFLLLVTRWLARDAGVRQFLVVGAGIPHGTTVHAVAQRVTPGARVVYADHDPVVLAHAHELVRTSTDEGEVVFVHADLRAVERIVERASETLDRDAPVGLLLAGVLHHLPDADDDHDPRRVVGRLVDAVAPGSYLALCHLAADIRAADVAATVPRLDATTAETWIPRTRDEVRTLLEGLDQVPPGLVPADRWRPGQRPPGPASLPEDRAVPLWAGVGRS